jgi:hypothetical protein
VESEPIFLELFRFNALATPVEERHASWSSKSVLPFEFQTIRTVSMPNCPDVPVQEPRIGRRQFV